MGSTVDVSGV